MLKTYKYRLYPNRSQQQLILQHFGACRFIWNWSLEQKIATYQKDKKSLSHYDLNNLLPELKKQFPWLAEVYSQSLQDANVRLTKAFTSFFRENCEFPNFKSKKNPVQSFGIPQGLSMDFDKNRIRLPKIGWVRVVIDRKFDGTIKTAVVKMTATGKFFIGIPVDDGEELPEKGPFDETDAVGIDLGISHYAILSSGEKIENPKHLEKSLQRLRVLQRRLSRKQKGSKNRDKARMKVALLHERIHNQRTDFLQKLSTRIIGKSQAIAVETLDICEMKKNRQFARAINGTSWGQFVGMLSYKSEWNGKTLIRIGQFEPSSKLCNVCGHVNHELSISDRTWTCPECKTEHDRDINAAINIKKIALQKSRLITPRGPGIEPVDSSAMAER